METLTLQSPLSTAVIVVPLRVQTEGDPDVTLNVVAPEPDDPDEESVAVSPGRSEVAVEEMRIDWSALPTMIVASELEVADVYRVPCEIEALAVQVPTPVVVTSPVDASMVHVPAGDCPINAQERVPSSDPDEGVPVSCTVAP